MNNIDYNNLDLIYSNLSIAYFNNDTTLMKCYLNRFTREYPQYAGQMDICISCVIYNMGCTVGKIADSEELSPESLRININGCLCAINKILRDNALQSFSLGAIQTIYYPVKPFDITDELYRMPTTTTSPIQTLQTQPQTKQTLTVGDLLSVADYSIKLLDIIKPNERNQDISDTITIFKSIDLALNNKPEDKPLNKSLHIVNNVLTSVVKKSLDNQSDKRFAGGMGILIDLAIDFFCKK